MTNWKDKYPIGSQWKTRGGWRAVVVAHDNDSVLAWHDEQYQKDNVCEHETSWHEPGGGFDLNRAHMERDIIAPWAEGDGMEDGE